MQLRRVVILRSFVLLGLALTSVGCPSLKYPGIQRDFEEAVRLDNGASVQPFTEGSTDDLYNDISKQLSKEYIAKLDARLRPNAWLLRSFSAWRSGDLKTARKDAITGLGEAELQPGSRDQVLLNLMPALVIDSEINEKWDKAGRKVPAQDYQDYEADFVTAIKKADAVEKVRTQATPLSALYYVKYQRWRILQNWRVLIASIPDRTARNKARNSAKTKLGGADLKIAAASARDAIPPGHQLRALIAAQEAQ
jgi:hypothetical protein